ncbi:murein L,D-transpeptidase [Streptomyces sp. ISL-99]|uniref:L,D-transpeptidase family protein n=1 Tax=Streptomyces sp. ISL-99 TaxID=2819193 RepID=UPI001BE59D71|nr:L,D-transpeptidase family protein [Streptomyces sp. ISL-99]MBT2523947.1 murein L,D-transpeptidase [Streptomyces sp. ISL-99]
MDEKQRNSRAMRRAVALAAAAVVATTAGCTAQASGAGAGAGAAAAGGAKRAAAASAHTPANAPANAPVAAASSEAAPAEGRSEGPAEPTAEPKTSPPAPPAPKVLMASGAEGAQVRELQARLRQIAHFNRTPTGYYGPVTAAAVSSFQSKRGLPRTGTTDTVTWDKLLGMTRKPTRAELHPTTANPVAKPDPRCMTGRVLCISKTSRTLSWMVEGRVVSAMDVRFGSQYTPTREGVFSVYWKSRHHVSTLYDSPMPYALFFSGGQAVHYSSDFAARGYSGASHGCVNVRDEGKIASLFAQVRNGDKVVIYW